MGSSHAPAVPRTAYPAIGSRWKDRDARTSRTIRVVRYDLANRRVRIHCVETDVLTWAKPERFNDRSGGYTKLDDFAGAPATRRRGVQSAR